MIPAFVTALLSQGLSLVANAGLVKGKEWLQEKTGVNLDAATLSSADYITLQQYQMDHEEELIRLRQVDDKLEQVYLELQLADVKSAREMQVAAFSSESPLARNFVYVFALLWTAFAMAYIMLITFTTVPPDSIRFADTIQGFLLGTVVSQVLSFFFGSSQSSRAKDETLSKAIDQGSKRK